MKFLESIINIPIDAIDMLQTGHDFSNLEVSLHMTTYAVPGRTHIIA